MVGVPARMQHTSAALAHLPSRHQALIAVRVEGDGHLQQTGVQSRPVPHGAPVAPFFQVTFVPAPSQLGLFVPKV
jgi:hypothetical protein